MWVSCILEQKLNDVCTRALKIVIKSCQTVHGMDLRDKGIVKKRERKAALVNILLQYPIDFSEIEDEIEEVNDRILRRMFKSTARGIF